MKKPPRIQITPKGELLKVEERFRRCFVEEAIAVILAEGRFDEIVSIAFTKITGITRPVLTTEKVSSKPGNVTKKKMQSAELPVDQSVHAPVSNKDSEPSTKLRHDSNSIATFILKIVDKYGGSIDWLALYEEMDIAYDYCVDDNMDTLIQMLCERGDIKIEGMGNDRIVHRI